MSDDPRASDTRIAYGMQCVWWGDIQMVGVLPDVHLPCCPTCGGMLLELLTEEEFLDGAREYEASGHPGYVQFVLWLKGKCFKTLAGAQAAYAERGVTHI